MIVDLRHLVLWAGPRSDSLFVCDLYKQIRRTWFEGPGDRDHDLAAYPSAFFLAFGKFLASPAQANRIKYGLPLSQSIKKIDC